MARNCSCLSSIMFGFVLFALLFSPVFSSKGFKDLAKENKTSMLDNETRKMKLINTYLKKINKPFVKSIKSPDGDIIDCVLINLQPAFDDPQLKGNMILDPPELPKGYDNTGNESEIKQLWSSNGESCPNGTIPIRRTTASDILASNFISKFGNKFIPANGREHEHAIGYVTQGEFYGAKALLNVWKPNVVGDDFSLSQIWVISGASNRALMNTVEAGWQVYPSLYKSNFPRLFSYWTPNGYRSGCYNLRCSGFVQVNRRIAFGAAVDPISTYDGEQFDVPILIWKDPKSENWWLKAGREVMGYWPKHLFTSLDDYATSIEYGGEVYANNFGKHTSTQMGSGHFPGEGFKKVAYARNLEIVDEENNLKPVPNLLVTAEKSNCYDVKKGYSPNWGNYIFFGGPGNNPTCL